MKVTSFLIFVLLFNSHGTVSDKLTDINGNEYKTITIGNQVWMAENLRVKNYQNGDSILTNLSSSEWSITDRDSLSAYTIYGKDTSNVSTYGYLYNWYAVNDNRNLAPSGWHVPTDDDWKELEMYLGMSQSEANGFDWRGTDEGNKLMATSLGNGTNTSGFTALLGGYRYYNGSYYNIGKLAIFWSSTELRSSLALNRYVGYEYSDVKRGNDNKKSGFSVRLVKDK